MLALNSASNRKVLDGAMLTPPFLAPILLYPLSWMETSSLKNLFVFGGRPVTYHATYGD